MKRLFDFVLALTGLLVASPILLLFMLLIWFQDAHSPFYIAPRIGRNGKKFQMIKLRSMIIHADQTGVDSTASDDNRITWIGHIIRRYKLDELSQLWNVLCGHMSLVGPRPNVARDVNLYTDEERHLLDVRPGITDLSSIVFADEGKILSGSDNPDLTYNQIIRPWKSRLGLFYIQNQSLFLDIEIIFLTALAILSRPLALNGVQKILMEFGAENKLLNIVIREEPLYPYPPPGTVKIIKNRNNLDTIDRMAI